MFVLINGFLSISLPCTHTAWQWSGCGLVKVIGLLLIPDVVSCMFFFLLSNLLLVFLGVVCTHNLEIFHSIKTKDKFFSPPWSDRSKDVLCCAEKTILLLFCVILKKINFVLANQLFDNSCCCIKAVTFCKCIMGNYERSDLKAQLSCFICSTRITMHCSPLL